MPVIGYHHVLMIFIAVAIVLLGKLDWYAREEQSTNSFNSATTCRMFLIITSHSRHLLNIPLLPKIPGSV